MSVSVFGRRAGQISGFLLLPALLAAVINTVTAEARPQSHLSVKYYTVTGPDDRSLDQQMARLGPSHRGGRAYATLSADPSFKGRLEGGKYCRLASFQVRADFIMTLPRLASGARLTSATNARWKSFAAFVRRHEEGHRSIWLGCLARGEARALKLRIRDCSQLDAAVEKVFKEEWVRCERLHDAFDTAEQIRLRKHPLIVAAARVRHQVALAPRPANVRYNFSGSRAAQ